MGERGFLAQILPRLNRLGRNRFLVPPGDDAAVMKRPARAVLSIDGLTEGTHFKLDWGALLKKKAGLSLGRALGWKLMGSSLSDLAAMGRTEECWALVFLGGPKQLSSQFLMDFYKGVRDITRRTRCVLAGGDTVRSSALTLVAAVGGVLKSRRPLTRNGCHVGDFLCVTGSVGDAERGLKILLGHLKNLSSANEGYFIRRFFEVRPLFKEGAVLAEERDVTSLIDLSDSLQESVELLLARRKFGYTVDLGGIPTSPPYQKCFGALPSLMSGGEDYALLFTVRGRALKRLQKKLSFSVIGRVLKSSAGRHLLLNGRPMIPPRFFQHFN